MNVNDSFPNKGIITGWMRDIAVAGTFLTRLPFRPTPPLGISSLGPVVQMFPIIGLIVGIIGGLVLWIAAQINLNPISYGFIGVASVILITGALHEDGLADFVDGIGAHNRPRRLEIMRDSSIGVFGVLALILSIGLKVALLGSLAIPNLAVEALIASAVVSRGMIPLLMYFMRSAQSDGLGHGAGRPSKGRMITGLFLSAVIAIILLDIGSAVLALFLSVLAVSAVGWLAHRRLAGYTGDVLGAAQQCAEIAVLIVAGATL